MIAEWLRGHSKEIETVSALAGIILTVFLLAANLWSAAETRRSLALARSQFAREWRVDLHLRILPDNDGLARVEVTSLSKSSALMKAVKLRCNQKPPRLYPIDVPLRGGASDTIPIGLQLRNFVDLQDLLPGTLQEIEDLKTRKQLSEEVQEMYPSIPAGDMHWRDQRMVLALCLDYDSAGTEFATSWLEFTVLVGVTIEGHARIKRVESSGHVAARS